MMVPWTALLGWAADSLYLDTLNFQRAFYRVETMEDSGLLGLVDQSRAIGPDFPLALKAKVYAGNTLRKARSAACTFRGPFTPMRHSWRLLSALNEDLHSIILAFVSASG